MAIGRSFPGEMLALIFLALSTMSAHAADCDLEGVYQRALDIDLGARDVKAGDRQVDPPTATGASAALVDSPRQTGAIATALQQGLVKRGGGGALAISLAPFAWLSAAKPPSYFDDPSTYGNYDAARRLTGSLTLGGKGDAIDADGDGTLDDPAEAKSLADSIGVELQYRFGSRDRRDHPVPLVLREDVQNFFNAMHESPYRNRSGVPTLAVQRRRIVNLPNATPRSQPVPLPESASETGPLVNACASADFAAPACAPALAYAPSTSSMSYTSVNLPRPSWISDLPNVRPPPLASIVTRIVSPLLQVMVPWPEAVL